MPEEEAFMAPEMMNVPELDRAPESVASVLEWSNQVLGMPFTI